MTGSTGRSGRRAIRIVAGVVVLIAIWKIAAEAVDAPVILPPPETVAAEAARTVMSRGFLGAVGATAARAGLGFAASVALGVLAGAAAGRHAALGDLLRPLVSTTRATPMMSVILLALIWFPSSAVPVFVSVLVGFPLMAAAAEEGVRAVDPDLLAVGRAYSLSRTRMLAHIWVPAVVPAVLGGASGALGLTWKVVVAAEVLSQPLRAVGTGLQRAQLNLDTATVLAWTVVAVVLSSASEALLGLGARGLLRRRGGGG